MFRQLTVGGALQLLALKSLCGLDRAAVAVLLEFR